MFASAKQDHEYFLLQKYITRSETRGFSKPTKSLQGLKSLFLLFYIS